MPPTPRDEGRSQQPTFVFKGTVRKLRSATIRDLPVNDQTITVAVDQVIEAPKSMARLGGTEITVQLSGREKLQPGQEMIFHTHGWIFGDSIAVQSVKQEVLKRGHAALLTRGGDPVEHRKNREIEKRYDEADMVVSGRVSSVRLPSDGQPGGRRAISAAIEPGMTGPVSEHAPHWREAVIEVHAVHKGRRDQKEVVIRFPASMDVRWYKAPKFEPGQQGYFMLHKTKISKKRAGGTRAALAAAEEPATEEVHTALHSVDFQPYDAPDGMKRIIAIKPGDMEG